MHDFAGMPDDLEVSIDAMRRLGPGIVKVAVNPSSARDLVRLAMIGRGAATPTVVIGMGTRGLPTRALPGHFGSCWTYAGDGVAPGQISSRRLLDEFRLRDVNATTPVYAVVGRPIAHSVSPAMHNAAFSALAMNHVYVPVEIDTFEDFLKLAEALPIAGASVTAPFKDAAAAATGRPGGAAALNTVRRSPTGEWEGLNTDVDGFLAPLADIDLAGSRVSVLGAGGAARSVVEGLLRKRATVAIHARRREAAMALVGAAGTTVGSWPVPPGSWDVLVNTTPVGTHPDLDATPMAGCALDGGLVYDLVYNPRSTRLLRDATAAGCQVIDGLEMLVQQAVRQFAWWTGVTPSAAVMRAAAERRLEEIESDR
jgi:3-dehydroquinate dehydratase/shikimate dehydrogenase